MVEDDRWQVSLWVEGEGGPPRMRLDGREVRGCLRHGDAVVCRFVGLRAAEHLLEVDPRDTGNGGGGGDGGLRLWGRVGAWDWRDGVIYGVIPDRFADGDPTNNGGAEYDPRSALARHGGDLAGLHAQLPYLRELGVNVIWTTPAVANVVGGVPHDRGLHRAFHGYWPERLEDVDAHLGSEAELRALAADIDQGGGRLMMDVVINHLGYGAVEAADPSLVRSPCPPKEAADDVTACLFGLPDLRTEAPEVAARVGAASQRWVSAARGAHAVRLDAAKHVERPFLKSVADAVRAERPDALVVGEVWGADPSDPSHDKWFSEGGLDGLYDFGFVGHALGFVTGRARPQAVARAMELRMRAADHPSRHWLHYLNTHDTPSFLHRVGDPAKMRLATTLLLTVWGLPVIFSGDEVGRLATDWPDNRPDFPAPALWDRRTLAHHKRLIELRRLHPALSRGHHRTLHAASDLLVFLRWWSDPADPKSVADAAIVALNRSPTTLARIDLPIPSELSAAPPMQGLSAEADQIRLHVPPMDALILTSIR